MPLHDGTPTFEFSHVDNAMSEHQPFEFNTAYGYPYVPSPTNTARTQWTAPPNLQPAGVAQQRRMDPRMQQNLHRLDTRQSPATQPVSEIFDSMLFLQQRSEPWNALGGMRNQQQSGHQNNFIHAGVNYGQHPRTCSDAGSNVPPSDSGYYTHQTLSVLSDEPGRVHQELPPGLLDQARNLNVARSPTGSLRRTADTRSVLSYRSGRSRSQRRPYPCREDGCSAVLKCASEHKKHMLRHEKNFICDVANCQRAGKGFSTINDLARHKKSVHKIGIEDSKSFMCVASGCEHKDKIWPRLDNFKQHIERMHKGEDPIELITRSEYHPPVPPETQQSLVVDPALLAGIGGPNDIFNSSHSHAFPYQSTVSFPASSTSTAEISPGPAFHQSSFNAPRPMDGNSNPARNSSFSSARGASNIAFDRRGPAQAVPTSVSVTDTPAPENQDREQMQISTAPQTKVEQQRQALARLLQANVDIEELADRILSGQQQGNSNSSTADKDHTARLIDGLLPKPQKPQSLHPTPGYASTAQYCEVEECSFRGRPCDLKKHMKRHRKPYGCTYPSCYKRFGAKSDWKRHENSQHFQLEAFRCDLPSHGVRETCAQHFHLATHFARHLKEGHGITSSSHARSASERCKIGKNCQGQYWCGFCRKIVALDRKRNKAWDERFDHIARHVEKEKRSIEEWVCAERNMTKRQLQDEMHSSSDEEAKRAGEEQAEASQASGQVQRQATLRQQCCKCCETSSLVEVDCYACPHKFCAACKRVYVEDHPGDDGLMEFIAA